jgi:iron complex outermembrane receptor protein
MVLFRKFIVLLNMLVSRTWNQKKYVILISLNRIVKSGLVCLLYFLVNRIPVINAQPDTVYNNLQITEIQQIEVAGHRNQAAFSNNSRFITTIQGEEIEKAGIQSFHDLLEYISNVDIRQRGPFGVQSDISIRGGSFDHVMVLVNGINLSDPQTGHASLDVPIDKEGIERIEILEGSAARILGAGAFSGAINIVTRQGNADRLSVSQFFGESGFLRTNVLASLKRNRFQHFVSAGVSLSKGYAPNTDFNLKNAYYRANYTQNNTLVDCQVGIQKKDFGAAGYYSPRFPDQYEETGLVFASIRASAGEKVRVSPLVYWRHRKDHFLLDRDHREFYENFHLTDIMGSQLNFSWHMGPLQSTAGFDLRTENILSNNLGFDIPFPVKVNGEDSMYYTKRYGRDNYAFFQEFGYNNDHLSVSGGFMVNWNSAYHGEPSFFPGFDISYRFLQNTRIYSSFNRALHLPTFTDLFYTDPTNQGNLHLNPNRIISWEGGIKHQGKIFLAGLAVFRNTGKDIIDWLWSYDQDRFSPVNLQLYQSYGLETSLFLRLDDQLPVWNPIRTISFNYIYLHVNKSLADSVSKYYNLKHKISLMISHRIVRKIEAEWDVSYQHRLGEMVGYNKDESSYFFTTYHPYWLLEGSIKWNLGKLVIYAILSNILNTKYIDAGSAIQPGRWFKAGITVNLEKR